MSITPPAPLPSLTETIARLNGVAGQLERHSGDIATTIERQLATFLGNAANQLGERHAQLAAVIQGFGAALLQIGGILAFLATEEESIFAGAGAAVAAQPEDEPAVERMATEAYAGVVAQAAAALNALVEGELAALQARLRTAGIDGAGLGAAVGVAAAAGARGFAHPAVEYFQPDMGNGGPRSQITEIGQAYIKQLEDMGVNIKSDPETQRYLRDFAHAEGDTQFWGSSPGETDVLLGANANNGTVYEEFLHVQRGAARGWVSHDLGTPDRPMEEVEVERQVLARADELGMTQYEQQQLQKIIDSYLQDLKNDFGITWNDASGGWVIP